MIVIDCKLEEKENKVDVYRDHLNILPILDMYVYAGGLHTAHCTRRTQMIKSTQVWSLTMWSSRNLTITGPHTHKLGFLGPPLTATLLPVETAASTRPRPPMPVRNRCWRRRPGSVPQVLRTWRSPTTSLKRKSWYLILLLKNQIIICLYYYINKVVALLFVYIVLFGLYACWREWSAVKPWTVLCMYGSFYGILIIDLWLCLWWLGYFLVFLTFSG